MDPTSVNLTPEHLGVFLSKTASNSPCWTQGGFKRIKINFSLFYHWILYPICMYTFLLILEPHSSSSSISKRSKWCNNLFSILPKGEISSFKFFRRCICYTTCRSWICIEDLSWRFIEKIVTSKKLHFYSLKNC